MRTRDAWLAAIAAALGISEEACRAKETAPAAAREVPSASASASAPVVAATAPSASAEVAPSATASAVASASAAPKVSDQDLAQVFGDPKIRTSDTGSIRIGSIGTGVRIQNPSCGASPNNHSTTATLRAELTVNLTNGGGTGDAAVVQSLRPRLRNCANHALAQDPNQRGRLTILANINAKGAVTSVSIANNTGLSESSATCMMQAVRSAPFPVVLERTIQIVIEQKTQSP